LLVLIRGAVITITRNTNIIMTRNWWVWVQLVWVYRNINK